MNIDEIIFHHSTLTNGTAGFIIYLMTHAETDVSIRIVSISLYFPDCLFGEVRGGNGLVRDYKHATPILSYCSYAWPLIPVATYRQDDHLNLIPIWEWSWCHCVFHVYWNARIVVKPMWNTSASAKNKVETLKYCTEALWRHFHPWDGIYVVVRWSMSYTPKSLGIWMF